MVLLNQLVDDDGPSPPYISGDTPRDYTDYITTGDQRMSLLQSALADHREELKTLLNDWSNRHEQVLGRVLAYHQSLGKSVPSSNFEHSQHKPAEFADGSDVIVEPVLERQTSKSKVDSNGALPQSLLSLRAGSSTTASKSFVKAEDSIDRADSFLEAVSTSHLNILSWCEEKYRQGEVFVRDTESHNILAKVVLSNFFQMLTGSVILANSIFLGYASDYAMQNLQEPSTPLIGLVEVVFTIFYAIELMLRMMALGWFYVFSPDWKWNLFDLFLVVTSAWGLLEEYIGGKSGSNSSVLRTARFPKMIRLLRAFRIFRAFRELRLILNLIVGSMKSMLWSIMLISIVSYVIGNVFLQAATATLQQSQDGPGPGISESERDQIEKYWSSLGDATLNLYSAVSGGLDWKDMATSIQPVGTVYFIIYLLYIAFFLFVITNTLTSLFISTALKYAETDHQSMIQNELRKKQEHVRKIRAVFKSITKGDRDHISKEDMDKVLEDPKMLAFMSSVEIDSADVEEFFNVLSNDGQDAVDIESFVVGCMKMRGAARSMDLLGLIHSHNSNDEHFKEILRYLVLLQKSISNISSSKNKDQLEWQLPPFKEILV